MKLPLRCSHAVAFATGLMLAGSAFAYPAGDDAYAYTGIKRLDYVHGVQTGAIPGRSKLQPGQYLPMPSVWPLWVNTDGRALPAQDAELSAALEKLIKGSVYANYSISILDLSDPATPVYAGHKAEEAVNVGSVGKVFVALALFQTLADLYPNDEIARERVLRNTEVVADQFSQYDHHQVLFWDPETQKRSYRSIKAGDKGSLWEYLDWMLSASSNSAAGMVQKELIALKHFGRAYPPARKDYDEFFKNSNAHVLGEILKPLMDDTAQRNGLDPLKARQGSVFTRGGSARVEGTKSYASTDQLMKYLYRMEAGTLVDAFSSREIKRLLYMTQRRIRYASHPVLNDSAVYFKSGSFYQCNPGTSCGKYKGNKTNRLASVAIVESPAGDSRLRYAVAITSNVLNVNSAVAHQSLALRLHRLIESRHPLPEPPAAEQKFADVPVDDPEDKGSDSDTE